MTSAFHPLDSDLPRPSQLNNPFGYEPHPLCLQAAAQVQAYVRSVDAWQEEISRGKMFGVLVAEDTEGRLGFLAAYSGLLADRNDWSYFVPAIFDFQQPDGYFKREEAQISAINREVALRSHDEGVERLRHLISQTEAELLEATTRHKLLMAEAKAKRDRIRSEETAPGTEERLIRESQYMKAELRRIKHRYAGRLESLRSLLACQEQETARLKKERRERSDRLQKWLFDHFVVSNALGATQTLSQIFASTPQGVPPSGAGECCAPKLLQYAYVHHLRPLCMGEFWWGESPRAELRRHLHYYPACRGKCHPILGFMLQGLDVEVNRHELPTGAVPEIIYEDDYILVVNKPPGLLSVPGKIARDSVWTFAHEHCPEAEGPLIVHRLDMSTSGLMVVAKTKHAHQNLQAQFKNHTVRKTYVALLEKPLKAGVPQKGVIRLPLRPDPADRPRQLVDAVAGKPAVTEYEVTGADDSGRPIVRLRPLTGRTHQLRVHCAHPQGLGTPIVGDTLYGTPSDRLYLHAARITFRHPESGEEMGFFSPGG